MPITSVSIGITARRRMLAERLFCVALNVLPVPLATKPAETLKRNTATDWKRLLMYVMAVPKRSIIVPSHTNIITMRGLQIENTAKSFGIPEPELT